MNKDMCVRCGEGVINIRVGAIIIKDDKILSFLIFLDSMQTANLPNVSSYITADEA